MPVFDVTSREIRPMPICRYQVVAETLRDALHSILAGNEVCDTSIGTVSGLGRVTEWTDVRDETGHRLEVDPHQYIEQDEPREGGSRESLLYISMFDTIREMIGPVVGPIRTLAIHGRMLQVFLETGNSYYIPILSNYGLCYDGVVYSNWSVIPRGIAHSEEMIARVQSLVPDLFSYEETENVRSPTHSTIPRGNVELPKTSTIVLPAEGRKP